MIRVLEERDDLLEEIQVQLPDGTAGALEVLMLRKKLRNDFDGTTSWADGMTWYRCNGIELTPQDDGTWASDGNPRLVVRRAP